MGSEMCIRDRTQGLELLGDIIINIGLRISALFVVIAVVDIVYQKWKFQEDMKMTKQEVKDEYKWYADKWYKCKCCGTLWEFRYPDFPAKGFVRKFEDGVYYLKD